MKRKLSLIGALSVLATLQACVAVPEYSSAYVYDYPAYYPSTMVYSGIYYSPGYYYSRPQPPRVRPHHPPPSAHGKDRPHRHPGGSPPSATRPPPHQGPRPDVKPRPDRPTAGNRPDRPRRDHATQPRPERPRAEARPSRPQAPTRPNRPS